MWCFNFILSVWFNSLNWIIVYLVLSCGGLILFKRLIHKRSSSDINELVVMSYGIAGTLFSLVLAFVVFALWQDHEEINSAISKEANGLGNLYSYSHVIEASAGEPIKAAIKIYTSSIINDEWEAMAENVTSEKTEQALLNLKNRIFDMQQKYSSSSDQTYGIMFDLFIKLSDLRKTRLHENSAHLPDLVWKVLFTGSIITFLISFFYRSENFKRQLILNALIAIFFAVFLFLCFSLDYPFTGAAEISSDPFKILMENQFKITDSTMNLKTP